MKVKEIKIKQYKSEYTVGVKVDAPTAFAQQGRSNGVSKEWYTIKTGTLEAQIRNKLYGVK